jgi:hypothetical protein
MPPTLPPGYVLPKPGIPKVFGFLNLVFGAALLLVGLGYIALAVLTPSFVRAAEANEKARLAAWPQQRAELIGRLKQQEEAAVSKEEREQFKAERLALETSPEPTPQLKMKPVFMSQLQETLPNTVFWVEVSAGVLFNLAMIAAGVGLVHLRPWGRRLSLWVAGLKVGRLAAMTALSVLVLIPMTTREIRQQYATAFTESNPDVRPAEARKLADDTARIWALTSTATSVGLLVFGSIYPALTLAFLTRPGARAACLATAGTDTRAAPTDRPPE